MQLSGLSAVDTGTSQFLSAGNTDWNNSSFSTGGALIYKTATPYTSGIPCIYMDFSATRVVSNGLFSIEWNTTGIIEIQGG
jgi:hypothetical protein